MLVSNVASSHSPYVEYQAIKKKRRLILNQAEYLELSLYEATSFGLPMLKVVPLVKKKKQTKKKKKWMKEKSCSSKGKMTW